MDTRTTMMDALETAEEQTTADRLGVTVHTVWFHLRKIYEKL